MKMKFGVATGRNERIDEIASTSRLADDLGYSHLTFIDSQNLSRDVYSMMAIAAANSNKIMIGHGVTNTTTRHPAATANATATIDELSGGRAFLGLGVGMSSTGTMGMNPKPMDELKEMLTFFRSYMRGEEATYKGSTMSSEWVRRPVPVFVGAEGPRSLQLCGQLADGVISTAVDPTFIKWKLELMEKGARKAGRDPSTIELWPRTMCYVAESKEAARREVQSYCATNATAVYFSVFKYNTPEANDLKERLGPQILEDIKKAHDAYQYYAHERTDAPHGKAVTQRLIDFFMLTGTPDDICEQIEKMGKIGVKTVSMPLYTIIDKKGMMREIHSKVMTRFRG